MNVKRKCTWLVLMSIALMAICGVVFAAVTAEEAAKLKTTLTPFGAERAGNKEGTIPAWTGGGMPPGGTDADLFPNEKPLYTITAQNMDKYDDKLSVGVKALLKKWPTTFHMDVYPGHRTFLAPEYLYEAAFKNATRAKLEDGGNSFGNAAGGPPFPIPKNAYEIVWNHGARWRGESNSSVSTTYVFTPTGQRILTGKFLAEQDYPYNYKGMTWEKLKKDYRLRYMGMNTVMVAPPDQVGTMNGGEQIMDAGRRTPMTYQYLVGQRRVRLAPNVAFDAPNPGNNGSSLVDESWVYSNSPEKYNWKLIGKKEMYILANSNKFDKASEKVAYMAHHPDPKLLRWELRRVWVVEANLKPGQRHIEPRRTFYADEDTWMFALSDMYDGQGKLWKTHLGTFPFEARLPGIVLGENFIFNLQTGGWMTTEHRNQTDDGPGFMKYVKRRPVSFYTPEGMATMGVR